MESVAKAGLPSDQGLLMINHKCVSYVPERVSTPFPGQNINPGNDIDRLNVFGKCPAWPILCSNSRDRR
jgi:hypothetical protein